MPTRHLFMKTLDKSFGEMKSVLKDHLSKQKYLCATADVWSSRAQSYLGVTIHFIAKHTFRRESYVIAFKQMHGKQTYDVLGAAIHNIFTDFGIEMQQLTNIVTDGGSNFCKMCKVYGKSLDVSTYVDDSPDNEQSENDDSDSVARFMEDCGGELFVNEILNFEANSDDTIDDDLNANSNENFDEYFGEDIPAIDSQMDTIQMPPQRRCLSHLCNLLSNDFQSKYLTGVAKSSLNSTLEKLNTLWVLTHKSSQAKTICIAVLGRCLQMPGETRWNSMTDAVKLCDHPKIQKKLNPLIQELKTKLQCPSARNLQLLTSNDFIIITQYVKTTVPVAQSLDVMQREHNTSQGYVLPVLYSMKHRIEQLDEKSNIARDFKSAMLKAIDFRFKKYFKIDDTNKDLILAAITLPRVKTNFIANDEHIIYAKSVLIAACRAVKSVAAEVPNEDIQNAPAQESDDDFLISFAKNGPRRLSIDNEIESEVSRFLVDDRSENSMLNAYPTIREVYFKFNTTLSSSAPVERVFSQSKMIFAPRRNRISGNNFEKTLLLKHNRQLLNENDIHL